MTNKKIITLLTDFGLADVYVGVMKGVIAQIDPQLQVIDLTHQIPPQNLLTARFALLNAYPYFPKETVHIAVVDPGVGSSRRAIAIQLENGYLVGPDNGLFSGVFTFSSPLAVVELTNSRYWRTDRPSTTFHGRDIFAPVGAHIANGVPLTELGPAVAPDSLVQLPIPEYQVTDTGITGVIQYIDRFGNLITNIPGAVVAGKSWSIEIAGLEIVSGKTYSDISPQGIIALVGSHGWVEIAVNGGSAQERLQAHEATKVNLTQKDYHT